MADRLGVSVRTLDRIPDLPRVKFGRTVRYRAADVEAWADKQLVTRYGKEIAAS